MPTQNDSPPPVVKERRLGLGLIMDLFDVGPTVAIAALSFATLVVIGALFYFVRTAPPTKITITSGPEGSSAYKNALKYAKVLERHGVKLNVLSSKGSLENLQRLADATSSTEVGFVQVGITDPKISTDNLVSLGSIAYQPILVFTRGNGIDLLSELKGKKIAIGPEGSGTRNFALMMLSLNGISDHPPASAPEIPTTLLDWDAEDASQALLEKKIDAAFIMSESASTDILHKLLHSDEVHLVSFRQASAYARKIDSLNVLDLPEGSIDLGQNIPAHDVALLGPMVELIANKNLHPALSDLLLEAAVEVHGRPGIFQKRGEFPTPIEHTIRISEDANRFFKSGKSFLYRYLPFWLASLVSRILVVFLPMVVVLIPAMKSIPAFFKWRTQSRIRRHYRELLTLEEDFRRETNPAVQERLRREFDRIDEKVNRMKVRAAFADQFYGLRGHIAYVRDVVAPRVAR